MVRVQLLPLADQESVISAVPVPAEGIAELGSSIPGLFHGSHSIATIS